MDFSKAFGLVSHDWPLTKLAALSVDSRVVVWVRNFLVGCTQMVTVGGQFFKKVKGISGVPQGTLFGPSAITSICK
jgi:hypothetical protein